MIVPVICVGHRVFISGYTISIISFIQSSLEYSFFVVIVVLLLSFVLYVLCMIKYTKC